MLAILKAKKEEMGARWIVFDGIDVLLTLLQDPISEMREIYRVRDWLAETELTSIITAKLDGDTSEVAHYSFMQFMVDCAIRFERRLDHGIPVQRLQITKYRGSAFAPGEFPLRIGRGGMEVTGPVPPEIKHEAPTERVSAGFERLDSMLSGCNLPKQILAPGSPPWRSTSRGSERNWRCTQKTMKRRVGLRPKGMATCVGGVAQTR